MIRVWIVSVGRQVAGCLRGLEEGGLPAQVNEVVWERGLGPDCTMCAACSSLGGIFLPHWWDCLCLRLCMRLLVRADVCMLMCESVCGVTHRMTPVEAFAISMFNVGICAFTAVYTCSCSHACPLPLMWGGVCSLIRVFSDVCVRSDHYVYTATIKPPPTPPISLPFRPSLHHFTRHHQGLTSWCLHCKSGLTKRRWLDPTHIQKHLIYLFIFLSCAHGIKTHNIWPGRQTHFQMLFLAMAGQPTNSKMTK